MANRRMITSNIFSDDVFMTLDDFTRLLWIGLITVCADDQGRLQNNSLLIKSQVFPADNKSASRITKSIKIIEKHGMICCYKADGKDLIQITNWWKHQAPSWAAPSNYQAPDGWIDRVKVNTKGNNILTENWSELGGFAKVPTQVPAQVPTQVPTQVPAQEGIQVNKNKVKNKNKNKLIEEDDDARARVFESVFAMFSEEIGQLTKGIRGEILDMLESGVPPEWFRLAFRECAFNNARSWAYAKAILNRWIADGKVTDNRKNGSRSDRKRASPQSGGDIDAFRALARAQQQANETKREESERRRGNVNQR